jgi:hypothetical protein
MVAEKNSVWRSVGIDRHDAFDGRQETHVEHAVGLIQHQDAHVAEGHQVRG